MKIARVFPRRTRATPTDSLAFVGPPPEGMLDVDEVHISVTFSWDIPEAQRLFFLWSGVAPVRIGGPALGDPGDEFDPGKYLAYGYVITSRGCPNRCWFCDVPRREGSLRELPICDGWNVLDSNLLACSEQHIRSVVSMLKRQHRRAQFTGGLEAKRLRDWHVDMLADLRPEQLFMAYDTPDDLEPLIVAGRMLERAGLSAHDLRCYVLMGWKGDTQEAAERRCREAWAAGFFPMAMLYQDARGHRDPWWKRFARTWCIPQIVAAQLKAEPSNAR